MSNPFLSYGHIFEKQLHGLRILKFPTCLNSLPSQYKNQPLRIYSSFMFC